ncbi:MAG TPA: ABC transporter permease [Streptosporangiaceae bacterium]|nr:ABC transporter permease [Streptosporangiaceae bacterium]
MSTVPEARKVDTVPEARKVDTVQAQPATRDTVTARGASLRCALRAEWTKLRTVSGPAWLLLGVAALTVAVSAAATGATHCPAGLSCPVDPTKLSLSGVQFGQAVVAVLAVLMVSNEYSTGMMRVTLAAMPNRLAVLAAKAILLAVLVLVAGAVGVFGSVLAGHLILPGHGFTAARGFRPVWLSNGPTLRAACGSVLYLALVALMSLGVAMIVRDSAVSIGAALALLYVFPIVLAFIENAHWQHRLERWTPTVAGLTIQDTTGLHGLPITPWAGLGVLAIWAGAAMLAGGLAFRFRDA